MRPRVRRFREGLALRLAPWLLVRPEPQVWFGGNTFSTTGVGLHNVTYKVRP